MARVHCWDQELRIAFVCKDNLACSALTQLRIHVVFFPIVANSSLAVVRAFASQAEIDSMSRVFDLWDEACTKN